MEEQELGACGLRCRECSIFKAHSDENAAKEMLGWMINTHRIEKKHHFRRIHGRFSFLRRMSR